MSEDVIIRTATVSNTEVVVYGVYDEGSSKIDWYDLYVDGTCINDGDPLWEAPSDEEILEILLAFNDPSQPTI